MSEARAKARKQEVITREDVETALLKLGDLRNNLNTMVGGIDALKAATENLIEALNKADAGSGKLKTIIKVASVCMSIVALVIAARSAYGLVATMAGGEAAVAGLTTIDTTGTLVAAGAGADIVTKLGRQKEILSKLSATIASYFGPKRDSNSYYKKISEGMGELTTIASSVTEGVKDIGSPVLPESTGLAKAASVISYAHLAVSTIASLRGALGYFRAGKKDPLDVAMDKFLDAVETFLKLQTLSLDNPPLRKEPVQQQPHWRDIRGIKRERGDEEEEVLPTPPTKRPTGPSEGSSGEQMVEDRKPTKPYKGSEAKKRGDADRGRILWKREELNKRPNLDRIEPGEESGISSKRPRQ